MTTKKKYSDENAKLIIRVINDNNPDGILRSLAENGILVPDKKDIKPVLFSLYIADPKRWAKVLRAVDWNMLANNYTTNVSFLQLIKETALANGIVTQSVASRTAQDMVAKEWYNEVLDTLTGSSESTTTTTTTEDKPAAGSMTTKILIGLGIFVTLGIIAYFALRSPVQVKIPVKI